MSARQSLEYPVKAAYLHKFAPFLEWPPRVMGGPAEPVTVCILGADPFGPTLDRAVQHERVGPRPLAVRRLADAEEAGGCHIVYLGKGRRPVAESLRVLRGRPVVTVTDDAVGPTRGIIHFVTRENRVRFHIDDSLAAAGEIGISSKLLNLALTVRAR